MKPPHRRAHLVIWLILLSLLILLIMQGMAARRHNQLPEMRNAPYTDDKDRFR